jgi:hypothetical protein
LLDTYKDVGNQALQKQHADMLKRLGKNRLGMQTLTCEQPVMENIKPDQIALRPPLPHLI